MWWGIIVHYFKDEILSYHNIISNNRTVQNNFVFLVLFEHDIIKGIFLSYNYFL